MSVEFNAGLQVASFTDAWIETGYGKKISRCFKSHLLQMRGLKLDGELQYYTDELSHLLQMRGLKQMQMVRLALSVCRIFYRCVD